MKDLKFIDISPLTIAGASSPQVLPRVIRNWKSPEEFAMPSGIFKPNTKGREFMSFETSEFRDEAFAQFGFTELFREPDYRNFVGHHFLNGAYTPPHTDSAPKNYLHVRANWMLRKPPSGGDPVLAGVTLNVNPGDLWICFASEEVHASTPAHGGERFVCSFGALVKRPENFNLQSYSGVLPCE